ncbi:MAG: hypothetical protein ACYCUI_15865 [Vulcanimicrobiaceae bacterium]
MELLIQGLGKELPGGLKRCQALLTRLVEEDRSNMSEEGKTQEPKQDKRAKAKKKQAQDESGVAPNHQSYDVMYTRPATVELAPVFHEAMAAKKTLIEELLALSSEKLSTYNLFCVGVPNMNNDITSHLLSLSHTHTVERYVSILGNKFRSLAVRQDEAPCHPSVMPGRALELTDKAKQVLMLDAGALQQAWLQTGPKKKPLQLENCTMFGMNVYMINNICY